MNGDATARIEAEQRGAVTVVRMCHEDNRFHPDMLDALHGVLDEIASGDGPAALVLTGSGKFFSNGLDLDHMGAHQDEIASILDRVHRLYARLLGLDVPVIAAVNGHAFAAGAMLVLACDVAVMREDRGYFCLPEADLGIPFTVGMNALTRARLSPPVAHQAMVLATRFTAHEALVAGIVAAVAPEADVVDRAVERAASLAGKPRAATATIKRRLYGEALELLESPEGQAMG